MSAVIDAPPTSVPLRASRGLRWCVDALRLWRRAPWKLLVLGIAPLVFEGLLQLVPWIGVTLSKLAVPMLIMGVLLGLDALARKGTMRWASLFDAFGGGRFRDGLLLALLWGGSVFALQQLGAALVYGWPAVDAVWLGHMTAHRALQTHTFENVLILPGVVVTVLLALAPTLFLFGGRSPWRAVGESLRFVVRHPAPFMVFALINIALVAAALSFSLGMLLLLAWSPWSIAGYYVIWRDVQPRIAAHV